MVQIILTYIFFEGIVDYIASNILFKFESLIIISPVLTKVGLSNSNGTLLAAKSTTPTKISFFYLI